MAADAESESDSSTFPQSINRSIHQSTAAPSPSNTSLFPAMAADPQPMDILELLRAPVDQTAWCCATGDKENLPLLPLLWSISQDGTKLIAMALDAAITPSSDPPKLHTAILPVHLHGFELFFSIGHLLLLEKRGSLSGIHLYNPFSSQFARLPPSPSISSERAKYTIQVRNVTVSTDTKCPIALASLHSDAYPLAYTHILGNSVRGHWIDLTHAVPIHPISGERISFIAPFVYMDGLFYAVDKTGTRVYSFDFTGAPDVQCADKTFDLRNNCTYPNRSSRRLGWCCHQSASLVISDYSLFLVRWRKRYGAEPSRDIDVFRFDYPCHRCHDDPCPHPKWVPMGSLDHHSFYFGNNLPTSLSAKHLPKVKSDRVFISFDAVTRISGGNCPLHYDDFRTHLFYDLEDNEDKQWGCFHDAVSRLQIHCHPPFTVWMLPPAGMSLLPVAVRREQRRAARSTSGGKRSQWGDEVSSGLDFFYFCSRSSRSLLGADFDS